MGKKYKKIIVFLFFLTLHYKVMGEEKIIELETEKSVFDISNEYIEAKDGVILKYEDIKIKSDILKKLEGENILVASGNVILTQGDQVIKAKEIIFDLVEKKAKILNSESYDSNLKLRFGGEKTITEGKDKIIIENGWITTSPYKDPSYKMNAGELYIYPNKKLIAKNMAINIKGKDYLKIPYYITSLKSRGERATLFPYIARDNDKGTHGVWGFDYEYKNIIDGFVDFEISERKKLSLKTYKGYKLSENNSGNLTINRYSLPLKNKDRELSLELNHKFINSSKKTKYDRKFYDLGNGIWDFGYKNTTTNLMYLVDGESVKEKYGDFVKKNKYMSYYDFKINQEMGKNGEFNFEYYWTQNRDALRKLTEINDRIVYLKDLDPIHTDVDLYRRLKYTNGNDDILINVENEDFFDVNPGYVGDGNSYRKKHYYLLNLKSPKIKMEYLTSNQDKYDTIFEMRERDNNDSYLFKNKNNRWLKITEYDKVNEWSFKFGEYYPFRRNYFFGERPSSLMNSWVDNLYFGMEIKRGDKKLKEYSYDYTRDNYKFDEFFRDNSNILDEIVYNDNRVYKIYENAAYGQRAKNIISEDYNRNKINMGNKKIYLSNDNYINMDYSMENINYSNVYVPDFSGVLTRGGKVVDKGRKIEDKSSITGYRLELDENKNPIKVDPRIFTQKMEGSLFTKLYDNGDKFHRKYDLKITNEIGGLSQITRGENVSRGGYDIVKVPTNALELKNDFNASLGNVNFNYKISARKDKHFKEKWKKGEELNNFLKIDIDKKRFLSFNGEKKKTYEFKDYKDQSSKLMEVQYGYENELEDKFLYKYKEVRNEFYPYNEVLGWDNNFYKEKNVEKIGGRNYNQWGIEYVNKKIILNDLFFDEIQRGKAELKSKLENYNLSLIYDTSRGKEKLNINHYLKMGVGTGKKEYRDINKTPLNPSDDRYISGKDYFNFGLLYRYEDNKIAQDIKGKDEKLERLNKYNLDDLFNLDDFNRKIEEDRKIKKYFQVGLDLQLDGTSTKYEEKVKKMNRINDLSLNIESGYLEKFFTSYRFTMERPDRIYRDDKLRKSKYNYRKHNFEIKYSFGKEKDKPWWIGGKFEYVQNGKEKLENPEIYESSNLSKKVNKLTLGLITLSHRVENFQWEVGGGMKWDRPENKKLGYYPVISFKFSLTPFGDKGVEAGFIGKDPKFKVGL